MSALHLNYTVRFLCPAFLGNAEQSGQWRTPPFKALLRQWWRVAYAAGNGFPANANAMRSAEGALFGAAADAGNSNQSRVRLRLDRWEAGRLERWDSIGTVWHPEVEIRQQGRVVGVGRDVGGGLYLGYGPLTLKEGRTMLKGNAAIQAGESAVLHLALAPDVASAEAERFKKAIALINLYGTVGGRSRNGWGSLVLVSLDGTPSPSPGPSVRRRWQAALALDWPHAIGEDQKGPLVWQTPAFSDWKAAMRRLAEIKILLRTRFKFPNENSPHPQPRDRHWLSYPVTHHGVRQWGERRLPNSLRFKLRPDGGDRGRLRGVIFHVPCLPPPALFAPNLQAIQAVWQSVHEFLDSHQQLNRIAA
jgi:CRISPR-associated protein Cmr1